MDQLSNAARRFILHWGEMGTRWGVNRTVAQIHALLYLSDRPLHAEEIAETLSIARSNVSTSLRELQGWGIVRVVHRLGDRRDHFESLTDVWQMFQVILAERKSREIDPTVAMLEECVAESRKERPSSDLVQQRLEAMLVFFQTTTGWYESVRRLPQSAVAALFKAGRSVQRMTARRK
jgi:DNA-binding transcriptional regulator GbsR (MarR family)